METLCSVILPIFEFEVIHVDEKSEITVGVPFACKLPGNGVRVPEEDFRGVRVALLRIAVHTSNCLSCV